MRSRQLHLGDMIIQVNGEDVRGMSHHDVVSRIKASSQKIVLTVQDIGELRSNGYSLDNYWSLYYPGMWLANIGHATHFCGHDHSNQLKLLIEVYGCCVTLFVSGYVTLI